MHVEKSEYEELKHSKRSSRRIAASARRLDEMMKENAGNNQIESHRDS